MKPKTTRPVTPSSETFAYRGAKWHRKSLGNTGLLYDGANVVADLDGSTVSRFYVTPMLDQNVSMTVTGGAQAGTYFYSQDERHSVRTLTDASGAVVTRYDYTVFGEPVPTAGTGATSPTIATLNRYTYTGRELNAQSGDYYFRYRVYRPSLGRFHTRDPLGYVDGTSLYAGYFAQKMGIDPTGLAELTIGIAAHDAPAPSGAITMPAGATLAQMIKMINSQVGKCDCVKRLTIIAHGNFTSLDIGGADIPDSAITHFEAQQQLAQSLNTGLLSNLFGGNSSVLSSPTNATPLGLTTQMNNVAPASALFFGQTLRGGITFCENAIIALVACNIGNQSNNAPITGAGPNGTIPHLVAQGAGVNVVAPNTFVVPATGSISDPVNTMQVVTGTQTTVYTLFGHVFYTSEPTHVHGIDLGGWDWYSPGGGQLNIGMFHEWLDY